MYLYYDVMMKRLFVLTGLTLRTSIFLLYTYMLILYWIQYQVNTPFLYNQAGLFIWL